MRDGGRPRLLRAHIERSRLIVAAAPDQERVPIVAAEQRPGRDRAHVRAAGAQPQRRVPDLLEPAELLLAGAAEMDLGRGERQPVAAPGVEGQALEPGETRGADAHRVEIEVAVAAVVDAGPRRITLHPVVQEALAGRVVVEPDDVRRAGVGGQLLELTADAGTRQIGPERMPRRDPPGQEIEGQPAARVLVAGLIGEPWRAVGLREVLGLNQPRARVDLPDRAHREPDRHDLVDEDAHEQPVVTPVRMP
jgi:hypothetical protein